MISYNTELYPFKSRWIEIENNKMHYIDEGQGDVILFSHPPLASSFMYRKFVSILSKKYRCIAIDYPNFGLSKASEDYKMSLRSQSDILEQFILKRNLKNIFVLGHDTGGPSAFKVVIKHPNLFKGLILTDTIIYPVNEYPKLNNMLGIVGGSLFTWFNKTTNFLIKGTYKYGIKTRKLTKQEKNQYKLLFNTWSKRTSITRMLYSLKKSKLLMDTVKRGFETTLNKKQTLLIYGEEDPVNKLGIPDRIHALMQNSELYFIKNEGHFPHEAQPERMCEIIDNWISKITN